MLVSAVSEYVNRSLWILKFGVAIGAFIGFWWQDNSFFNGYAEFARVVSFIWLIIQGLLLLDFCHDAHDLLMNNVASADGEDRSPYAIYIILSIIGLFLAILGLVYLFMDYTGCDIGMFFTVLTVIMGVITTFVSLTEAVSKGLLTPCLMFAYSVFMCWYALLSSPDKDCNPTADFIEGGRQLTAIIVVSCVSVVILLYCVVNGTKIFNIFNPEGEGVMASYAERPGQLNNVIIETATTTQPQASETGNRSSETTTTNKETTPLLPTSSEPEKKSSGTPHERAFFLFILALTSCYGAMILTNWGKTNGAPPAIGGSTNVNDESLWLKIVNQWIFLILYCRVLQVAYFNNREG